MRVLPFVGPLTLDALRARCIVDEQTGCWLWLGSLRKGYGRVTFQWITYVVHVLAYTLAVGPVPEGKQLDHLCRIRHCFNPAHLEPVTGKVNVLRGAGITAQLARQSTCLQGHPFTPENTYTPPAGHRRRVCRICQRARVLAYRRRREAA